MEENLLQLFAKGGAFMWPLLILSLVAAAILMERFLYFGARKYRVGKSLKTIQAAGGDAGQIPKTKNPLFMIARAYLDAAPAGKEHLGNMTERSASQLIHRHEHGLRLLATIGNVSPLVGLLGTVWGMVQAFSAMAELGDQVQTADLAAGIYTGLLTTVAGLLVAIPAIFAARSFEARIDRLTHDLNETVSHLDEWSH